MHSWKIRMDKSQITIVFIIYYRASQICSGCFLWVKKRAREVQQRIDAQAMHTKIKPKPTASCAHMVIRIHSEINFHADFLAQPQRIG